MWYECLPCLAIIGVAMYSYQISGYYITQAMIGKPRRSMESIWERTMAERDTRIGGVPWNCPGLENIPDK